MWARAEARAQKSAIITIGSKKLQEDKWHLGGIELDASPLINIWVSCFQEASLIPSTRLRLHE